jgi:hypothetical protein
MFACHLAGFAVLIAAGIVNSRPAIVCTGQDKVSYAWNEGLVTSG